MGERPKRQPKDNKDPNYIYTTTARETKEMAATKEDLERIFEKFAKKMDERCQTYDESIRKVKEEQVKLTQRQETLEEKWSGEMTYKTLIEKKCENNMPLVEEKIKKAMEKVKKEMSELPLFNNENKVNPPVENIEVTMPRFYGNNRDIHPKEFLVNLRDYFKTKKKGDYERMLYVKESLHSQAANWFSMMRHSIGTYEEFEKMFYKNIGLENFSFQYGGNLWLLIGCAILSLSLNIFVIGTKNYST